MAKEKYDPDETDFDDAIIEIACEIEYLNSIKKSECTNETHISLKSETEVKKVESISYSLVQILKTIQEVQISSSQMKTPVREPPSTRISKYIPSSMRGTQPYHPITITESPIKPFEDSNLALITIEDLYEDDPAENTLSDSTDLSDDTKKFDGTSELHAPVLSSKESAATIPTVDNIPINTSISEKVDSQTPKTIDIPTKISVNIGKQLKNSERDIFKNYLKRYKK